MKKSESTQAPLVLVVDDDESIRTYLRTLFVRKGYTVIEAAHGSEALEKAREHPPTIVISDILMPTMDGYELCLAWRNDECLRDIPFVFCTGTFLDEDDEKLARSFGADDFIIRPIELNELLQRIDAIIGKKALTPAPAVKKEMLQKDHFQKYRASLVRKLVQKTEELKLAKEKIEQELATRAMTDERLRKSEELFRAVFKQHAAVKLLIDPNTGAILDANAAAEKFYGWSRDELRTMRIQQINTLPPEQVKEEMERARKAEKNHFNFRHRRADGSIRDVEVYSSAIKTKNREFLHSIVHDVTEKKTIEQALRESEERYRALVETAPCIICTITPDGTTVYVNPYVEIITGYTPHELIGKNWWDIFYPGDLRSQVNDLFRDFCNADVHRYQMTLITKSGEKRLIEWDSFNEYTPDDSIIIIKGIGIDVTKRIEAEEQLRNLTASLKAQVEARTAELQKAQQELESFVYTVAHDLRAPVRHISGFLQFLHNELGSTISEKAARFLNNIEPAVYHMSTLIDGLLDFARLGKIELHTKSFDIKRLVEEILEDFKDEIARHRISVRLGDLHVIEADRSLIRAAMVNLIGNAIKFSSAKEKPEIEIACTASETEHIISVRDNGVGFDMRYANKLFGIFQRLHGEKEFSGTGIGLASVKRIINRHDGRVWAEGEMGKGACFFISLPRKKIENTHASYQSSENSET